MVIKKEFEYSFKRFLITCYRVNNIDRLDYNSSYE